MEYISTTDLRTKAMELRESLEDGNSVYLIHRSKVLGVISPLQQDTRHFDYEEFMLAREKLPRSNHKYASYAKLKSSYVNHLKAKYGESVS